MENAFAKFLCYAKQQKGLRHTPKGFMAWNAYIAQWSHSIQEFISNGPIGRDLTNAQEEWLLSGIRALSDKDIPPRYVPVEMWTAWVFTKTPALTWNRPEVLPGYVLFLPIPRTDQAWKEEISTGFAIVAAMVLNTSQGLLVHYIAGAYYDDVIKTTLFTVLIAPDIDYNDKSIAPETRLIASLAINSWLIHAYEPSLIQEVPEAAKAQGFGHRADKRSPIAPTWIGRNFKIRRESLPSQGQETGIKVRPHWRCGHWHTVRHGKGKERTRTQWYRPVYVNADQAA